MPNNFHKMTRGGILIVMILASQSFIGSLAAESQPTGSPSGSGSIPQYWISNSGQYRLHYRSLIEPIVINQIHNWVLQLETVEGKYVSGARITLEGGMPEHDHGLPTRPRITEISEDGGYLVEGIRFHMRGHWELEIKIGTTAGTDSVLVLLDL